VYGWVVAHIDHARITGQFQGALLLYDGTLPTPDGEVLGACWAADHRFVMDRE
jgi:hypothetical protein